MTDDDASRLAELEADNRRLRRLLDQRDLPAELRHQLINTLAVIRVIVRKSALTERDASAYAGHIEDRIAALARAQLAANVHGGLDLESVVANELTYYGAKEGEQLRLQGPRVVLMPKAGQTMALAVHELAVNAVEHGALGAASGEVHVDWSLAVEGDVPVVTFTWKETGQTGMTAGQHRGFGTEIITQTLAYELKAKTAISMEEDGLRCTIAFPLPPHIGSAGAA
jgi:two-component sensor histidine kinase